MRLPDREPPARLAVRLVAAAPSPELVVPPEIETPSFEDPPEEILPDEPLPEPVEAFDPSACEDVVADALTGDTGPSPIALTFRLRRPLRLVPRAQQTATVTTLPRPTPKPEPRAKRPAPGPTRAARLSDRGGAIEYPRSARRRGLEGKVMLRVLVGVTGAVERVEVKQSSGHEILDDAAVDAVRRWVFSPALSAGRPVEQWIERSVRFRLLALDDGTRAAPVHERS